MADTDPFDLEGFVDRYQISCACKEKSQSVYYNDGQRPFLQKVWRVTLSRPSGQGYAHKYRLDWTTRDTPEGPAQEPGAEEILRGVSRRAATVEREGLPAPTPLPGSRAGDQEVTVNRRFALAVADLRNFLGEAGYRDLLEGLYGEQAFAYSSRLPNR